MPTNVYFDTGTVQEKKLYEDLIIEQLKAFGQDCYYLPRTLVARDTILNEDSLSKFSAAYMIEMYVEDVSGFAGEGDLISKFGLEIRDEVTFVVSRRRFEMLVRESANLIESSRPNEGDLVYLDRFKKFFQIDFVEHEDPFYQVHDLPVYKLKCSVYEYSHEEFDTGIQEIDKVETDEGLSLFTLQFALETATGIGALQLEPEYVNIVQLESGTDIANVFQLENAAGPGILLSETEGEDILTEDQSDVIGSLLDEDGNTIAMEDDLAQIAYLIQEVENIETIDERAQNVSFDTAAGFDTFTTEDDILDFTERNPFGDPKP